MQRLIVGALAAVIVLVGGFLFMAKLVPEADVRAEVTRSLRRATGMEPRISGSAKLAFLPRPAIRLEDVRLDDGERSGISTGTIVATVRLLPLLSGNIEIASIIFERPHLVIEIGTEGMRVAGLPLNAPAPPEQRAALPELRIVDGTIEFRAAGLESADTLTRVDASLAWSAAGLTASGTFDWRRTSISGTLNIADIGALRSANRSGMRIRLEGEGLRATFEGGLAFRNGPQVEGLLTVEGKSLRNLTARLGLEPFERGGLGPFSLKSQVALTPSAFVLSGLSIDLDGNLVEGGLTLKRDGGRALLQGTLASDTIDLTHYAAISAPGRPANEWIDRPIPLSSIDAFDLDLRLSARRIMIGKTEISRFAAATALKGGRLTLNVGEAQVFGGAFTGTLALVRGPAGADMKIQAGLTEFNLDRGLAELVGVRNLEGIGVLAFALEGSGKTPNEFMREFSGNASLVITRGAVIGVNFEQVLRRLERKPLSSFADLRGGRTPFERIAAKARFTEGSVMLEEIQIESSLLRVTLSGAASIARRDLELRGVASLVRPATATVGAKVFDLPFLLQGPWESPFFLPDADELIQRSGAAAPLLDAARAKNSPSSTVRSVIESLTGQRPAGETPAPEEPTAAPAPAQR